MDHYILDERGEPVPADFMTWAKWFEDREKRRVALTEFDGVTVSTVFLGINHNWTGQGAPVLWETMIFGLGGDEYQTRASSRIEALEQHREALEHARATLAARS